MSEFDFIRRYFAPLAKRHAGAFSLSDDAAVVQIPKGHELVVTKDAIVEGVHFLGDENPALIAQKLLRVNLSDLAAMGAEPYAYALAVMLPPRADEVFIKAFTRGLAKDQKKFGITLLGGDTVAAPTHLCFSLTAFGKVKKGEALRRNGAKVGDIIYVSGTAGDSALGLKLLRWGMPCRDPKARKFLEKRYYLPEPRIALGLKLRKLAHAAVDISDGLVADLSHICECSSVGARIYQDKIPVSQAFNAVVGKKPEKRLDALTGGDDYELLFTVAPADARKIAALSKTLQLSLTEIGRIEKGCGVRVIGENGAPLALERMGFVHFAA